MKINNQFVFLLLFSLLYLTVSSGAAGTSDEETDNVVLKVYCYDSFNSEWGPGPAIAKGFFEKTGIKVEFYNFGDAVTVLNQLVLEKENPVADVAIGLDNSLLATAKTANVLQPNKSAKLDSIRKDLLFDDSYHLIPFDFGHFAIVYDSETFKDVPNSLEALTADKYKDSLVIQDPRTSTPGLGFLLWTVKVYGDSWLDYWKRLKPSLVTVTAGWSQAYSLFLAGEAKMVLSYGTSPVYHKQNESTEKYKAAEFTDGHLMQIEGMGLVAGTKNSEEAKMFMDYMLDTDAQLNLALANIMLPVNETVELPESFDVALLPKVVINPPKEIQEPEKISQIIDEWLELFSN